MIGGKVLDTSALVDAGTGRTIYFRAAVVAATRLGSTLLIPTTAWAEAWAQAPPQARGFLELMAEHPHAVFAPLDVRGGREAGLLAASAQHRGLGWSVRVAHVAQEALARGYPVLTTDPQALLDVDPSVPIDEMP